MDAGELLLAGVAHDYPNRDAGFTTERWSEGGCLCGELMWDKAMAERCVPQMRC